MKIARIKTYLLTKDLSSSMIISRGGFQRRSHAVIKIETDQGIVGYGEAVGNAEASIVILKSYLSEKVINCDPRNINDIRKKLIDSHTYFEQKGSMFSAVSAIEMACWDIKAKAIGVPLAELLGGVLNSSLKLYGSDVYWEKDINQMVKRCENILALGVSAIKAHIGFKGPREDLERVKVIRETIGSDCELMIDLNCGYTLPQAMKAFDLWQKYDLTWIEEPLVPYDIKGMQELRSKYSIPIAAGENEFQVYGFLNLLQNRSVDYVMPDIGRVGGIGEAKEVSALARVFGIPTSYHNYSSGILLAVTVQVAASDPNFQFLEYDYSSNAFYQELFEESLSVQNARLVVPKLPGIGVQIRDALLDPYEF